MDKREPAWINERDDWKLLNDQCMICGRQGSGCHEIACGAARTHALDEPGAWLMLCSACHVGRFGVHNYEVWPIARQLAIKKMADPKRYNLKAVNMLRGRDAHTAITEEEVQGYIDEYREEHGPYPWKSPE